MSSRVVEGMQQILTLNFLAAYAVTLLVKDNAKEKLMPRTTLCKNTSFYAIN